MDWDLADRAASAQNPRSARKEYLKHASDTILSLHCRQMDPHTLKVSDLFELEHIETRRHFRTFDDVREALFGEDAQAQRQVETREVLDVALCVIQEKRNLLRCQT